ncbi:efflux RND transporter periplasmic adaptor subunit [Candidatus Protochlamydia phocaeensis]|uniref:efflux RND transporter periplasmic adaptor subunit n=1 Tax=Candidatus Protochlamydia phocaeensis TaxID=1414722 RepID=UPI0008385266|nr:efflux RND transporter periplasmic adaptor subunit [Candidatus Protochlamydia phocaeensis]
MKKFIKFLLFIGLCGLLALGGWKWKTAASSPVSHLPTVQAERRNFAVEVKTIGELEAARSTIIASSIKGDLGKIIDLIPDGVNVTPGQVLIKMDPSPFEEKVEKLKAQIKEQETYLLTLKQTLEWEINQAEHENKNAAYEVETAALEIEKITHGDGPQEISRLKGAMQKAWLKYDELNAYSNDLLDLQEQGFLNPTELKQAQKKLLEEQEAYEVARLQYESYINHVYPMQIKKAEASLKRAKIKQEEAAKTGVYKIAKAKALYLQAKQLLEDYYTQLREDEKELAQTQILAPAPGMVVHREEYRSGQKRKPRVGDILVKNQALMDLPDLSSMTVKTRVREVDLFKIGIGKKASIEVDAYPHLRFDGTVSSIGVLALADLGRGSEEKYFEVRINLDNVDDRLRPGMTARATIHAQQVKDSLAVPLHAVFEEQKQSYCYVACGPSYEKRAISTGANNEQWIEIQAGLNEGECVCLLNPLTQDEQ